LLLVPDNTFGKELLNERAKKNAELKKKLEEFNKITPPLIISNKNSKPTSSTPNTSVSVPLFFFFIFCFLFFLIFVLFFFSVLPKMDPEMEKMFLEEERKQKEAKKKEQLNQIQGFLKPTVSSPKQTPSLAKAKNGYVLL
jgi:hypothetical protein